MYKVRNMSAARWDVVDEDGTVVGQMNQGYFETWRAYDLDGKRLQVNGHDEWGGLEHPYTIANELVNW
jgi:hypothetical protein